MTTSPRVEPRNPAGPERLAALYQRVGPGGPQRRVLLGVTALIAALPSLVWAASGTSFVHDDWFLAAGYRGGLADLATAFWEGATSAPARPGASLYYTLTYAVFGTHPVLHTLTQAAINAAVGVAVFLVAEKLWRTEIACWVTAVYITLPNRGSTRLWAAVATNPLAVLLVLVAVLLLLRARPVTAGLLLAVAVMTYEGVLGLAVLALAFWLLQDLRARWRRGILAGLPVVIVAAGIFLLSPKRGSGSTVQGGLDRIFGSQFGAGIFEWPEVTLVGLTVVMVAILALLVLPSERQARYRPVLLGGFLVFAAAAAPYVLVKWPVGTDGFFDRANGVLGLGTAVIIGTVLAWLVDLVPARLGLVAGAATVLLFLVLNAIDVRDYRLAVDDGSALLDQVLVDIPPTDRTIRIVPAPEPHGGVAQFADGSNLSTAVLLARGDLVRFSTLAAVEVAPPPADAWCYDPRTRVLGACPAP